MEGAVSDVLAGRLGRNEQNATGSARAFHGITRENQNPKLIFSNIPLPLSIGTKKPP
jgi:hypothetical protein